MANRKSPIANPKSTDPVSLVFGGAGQSGSSILRTAPTAFFEAHIKPRNQAWSFKGYEFLRGIIADQSREIVIEKGAQLGFSTYSLGIMLMHTMSGRKIGYYMPTAARMKTFTQDRFYPMANADQEILHAVREADREELAATFGAARPLGRAANVQLIHVGAGAVIFSGLQSADDAKSWDMDGYILDESAEASQKRDSATGATLVSFLQDRVMASDLKLQIELSQPGIPGQDVDANFLDSDQKFWSFRCPTCKKWMALEERFPDCIARRSGRRLELCSDTDRPGGLSYGEMDWFHCCPKCNRQVRDPQGAFDPDVKWEWIAKQKSDRSGYHASQLFGAQMTASDVVRRWAKAQKSFSEMVTFTISVLGYPHAGDRMPITRDKMRFGTHSLERTKDAKQFTVAGLDFGKKIHCEIWRLKPEGGMRMIYLIHSEDKGAILRAIEETGAYPMCDRAPELHLAVEIVQTCKRGCLVNSTDTISPVKSTQEELAGFQYKRATSDRTFMMDAAADAVTSGFCEFPKPTEPEMDDCIRHHTNFIKDRDEASGNARYRKNENHYGMCTAHALLAVKNSAMLGITTADWGSPKTWLVDDAKHEVAYL